MGPVGALQAEDLARRVGAALAQRDWLLATAESCTGGLVSAAVTDIAGSSAWFDRGFVTYSNRAKHELLGVPMEIIKVHGAVSEETARAMVAGAIAKSAARVAVAITGIAGPGGAAPGKPVGTVCFAWMARDASAFSATRRFDGDRASVRHQSMVHALEGILELLCN